MTKSLALAPNLGFWKSTLGMKACHHGCVLSVKIIDKAKQTITEVEKKGHHLNIVSWCHFLQEFESGSTSLADSGPALSLVYLCSQCLSHPKSAHGYLCIFCLGGGLIAFEETCTLSF